MKVSEAVAHGESLEEFQKYLSMYPNNLFLVWLYKELICFSTQQSKLRKTDLLHGPHGESICY